LPTNLDKTEDMQILSKNGFEKVYEIIRRVVYDPLLVIETKTKKNNGKCKPSNTDKA